MAHHHDAPIAPAPLPVRRRGPRRRPRSPRAAGAARVGDLLRLRRFGGALGAVALLAAACTGDDAGSTTGGPTDDGSADEQVQAETDDGRAFEIDGPEAGALINADELERLRFAVTAQDDDTPIDDLALLLDGDGASAEDVTTDAERGPSSLVYEPDDLGDGEYVLTLVERPETPDEGAAPESAAGAEGTDDPAAEGTADTGAEAPDAEVLHEWSFTVDATPPELDLTSPDGAIVAGEPVMVAGSTEPGVTVTVDGAEIDADGDGHFELELDDPPDGELEVVATDEAGNATAHDAGPLVTVPSRVGLDEIRGIHVTPHAWATESFREHILGMVDDGLVNTVQLDLKDEGGRIGYDTQVELAIESGAAENVYTLEDAVAELHDRGVHIVGRIVAFRDPVLGQYAQDNDTMDWLIQTPEGDPYTGQYPCCFTSFANDDVIEYHLDLAEEAAAAGVDDILWDYIRRPDGSPDNMVVPGLSDDADGATLEDAVVDFAARADERLQPYGIGHGVSLYGIAADRPTQIAQDVPAMAEHVDYVAPMIYPSHWGPGEYGVEDPNRQPYDIIAATLEVWEEATEGTRARIVPWLEDTNYRAWDRPHQVREQIRATEDHGIDEWLMWDPNVNYTIEAYDPRDD